MDFRVQVPGLSYFSVEIVLGLRRHTLWSFWVDLREEGYALLFLELQCHACPSLIVAQSGGGDFFFFFFSSVDDSVLERSAALESLCFGIGFGRCELKCHYFCYIIVLFF